MAAIRRMFAKFLSALSTVVQGASFSAYCAAVLLMTPGLLADARAQNHRGGDTHFGPDGLLYIGLGDAAEPANSQSVTSFDGKIVRLNKDGAIPVTNPTSFTTTSGATVTTTGAFRAIWAIGLRNPYRFSFHDGTGAMRINDVGAGAWEEVNVGQAGANYGGQPARGCAAAVR